MSSTDALADQDVGAAPAAGNAGAGQPHNGTRLRRPEDGKGVAAPGQVQKKVRLCRYFGTSAGMCIDSLLVFDASLSFGSPSLFSSFLRLVIVLTSRHLTAYCH
jgi:hypothetical protein